MTLTAGPIYVSWNYTYACNFNCSHCYSRAPSYPRELATSEYERIADQMVQAGVFMAGFGGGEPLIRRDCVQILSRLTKSGIDTNITTNGWFVDDSVAARLKEANLSTLYPPASEPLTQFRKELRMFA